MSGAPIVEPVLSDGVVRLRPWSPGDLGCVERAAADPRIPEATTVPVPYTAAEGLAYVARQRARASSGAGVSLAVTDAASDRTVGNLVLLRRPQPGVTGLGYWVTGDARGRGTATRAVRMATAWGLRTGGSARIEAWVEPDNTASQRVLAVNGYRREGLLRSYLVLGSRRADVTVWSRLRDDPDPTWLT